MPFSMYGARWSTERPQWSFWAPYAAPDVGYKYRKFDDNGFRLFRDRAIWYAPLESLNDPVDCRIDVQAHLDQLIARHSGETRIGMILRAIRGGKVSKVQGGEKIGLNESINELLNAGGLFCLSASATEPLMWAHYSEGHRGFCVGFARWYIEWLRSQLDQHQVVGFGPVTYAAIPDLTHAFFERLGTLRNFDNEADRIEWVKDYAQGVIVEVLSTKSRHWRYEREYRSMRKSPGAVPFPPQALVEIIFGAHASEANQVELRQLLSGEDWSHLRFRRAQFSQLDFQLNLVDV